MQSSPSLRGFWILLLSLALVRGLIYGAGIPPWQAPDEPQHYEHARLIKEHGRLVSSADISATVRNEIISSMQSHRFWLFAPVFVKVQTADDVVPALQAYWDASHGQLHQPFLYYWLQGQLLKALRVEDATLQLYLMRFVSSLMGSAVILLTYFAVKNLFPHDVFLQVTVPSFVLFLPMHTHLNSAVNNDNLAELSATVVLFVITLILRDGLTLARLIPLVGAIIVGMYAKTSFLFVIPVAVLGILIGFWLHASQRARRFAVGLALVVVVVVISAISFMRVKQLSLVKRVPALRLAMGFPLSLPEMLRILQERWILYTKSIFVGFWGCFGWYSLRLPAWLYWILGCVSIAAGVGLIAFAIRAVRGSVRVEASQVSALLLYGLAFVLAFSLTVLRFLSANVAWGGFNVTDLPQGRFLFPAILAMGTLFMLGIRELIPCRYRHTGTIAVVGALVLLDLVSLVALVIPYYYGPF
jgi:hypothetical protein